MIALRVAAALLIAAALLPELSRYGAERRLQQASGVLQAVFRRAPAGADAERVVEWAASTATVAAGALPGDWRPLNLAGSAWLLARRPEAALDRYRAALALGERPEIVVNVGRAWTSLGREDLARAAFVRAAWVSPGLLAGLPRAVQGPVRTEVETLERALAAGRLTGPPAAP